MDNLHGLHIKEIKAKRVNIVRVNLVKESSLLYKNRRIANPGDAYELIKQFLGEVDREYLIVVCLDTKNQPTSINICHIGSINQAIVHPREVFKPAILSNAYGIIVAHNHPSEQIDPSKEDIKVLKRLVEAGKIIGVELIDSIIIGDNDCMSPKNMGRMKLVVMLSKRKFL